LFPYTTLFRSARGEHVPVGDEEVALVLVLQVDPVLERAVVIAEVQLTGRPHPGQNSFGLRMTAHVKRRSIAVPGRETGKTWPGEVFPVSRPGTKKPLNSERFQRTAPNPCYLRRRHRQIHHGRRFDTAMTAIEHAIHLMLEPVSDLKTV